MAKDTEKLIRQLSLISFLMAERRPVSALEIKQDVEGYSEMNDDAFARRFYADRAELEALGINLKVEKPPEGYFEAELYTLPPENFYLPPIEFSDGELAALQTSLALLDGRFAYAEPLRLALQQLSWGRPSPLGSPAHQRQVAVAVTASAGGRELSQRLAKVETAISRRKTIEFDYYSIERDEVSKRKVDPYHLLYQGGQFYLVGLLRTSATTCACSGSRGSGRRCPTPPRPSTTSRRPRTSTPGATRSRADWQLGEPAGTAQVWISERIAWLVERDFGRYGVVREASQSRASSGGRARAACPGPGVVFTTEYAQPRQLIAWVLGLGENARLLEPGGAGRRGCRAPRHDRRAPRRAEPDFVAEPVAPRDAPPRPSGANGKPDARRTGTARHAIRPERFARLVALAGILIQSARDGARPQTSPRCCERLQITERGAARGPRRAERRQLRRRQLRAVRGGAGRGDRRRPRALQRQLRPPRPPAAAGGKGAGGGDRPARRPPARRAASPRRAQKIVTALGEDPAQEGLQIAPHRRPTTPSWPARSTRRSSSPGCCRLEYYKENEDEFTERTVEPYALINGREGWYVFSYDLEQGGHAPLPPRPHQAAQAVAQDDFEPRPEVDPTADLEGWPRTGAVPASRVARVWIAPERPAGSASGAVVARS